MTLLETERLVRKITELLQQGGGQEIAPKLAGDYAAACHAANLRVQQCEAMIKAGDRPQAIQLAETAPNLLDLVTLLEFHGSDEWRAYCQQNVLPVPDRIDARSVHTLNECYTQGITTDHPLYAAYRSAVLNRNDEAALKTLQSITRLNPADTNAAAELARLDAKVLAARLQRLGALLAGADAASVVAEIEAIEAFGFKTNPDGDVWRKAQLVRCAWLLAETAKLQSTAGWLDALARLDFIRRLRHEFEIQLPDTGRQQLETLEAWARGEQAKDQKDREFQFLLGGLQQQINQSEEKDTSARYVKLPELREDFEALHKVWRSLTDFTRPIPEAAAASFRKRSALLEAEIARRTAVFRRYIIAGCLLVLAIGGVVTWLVLGQMKARDFTRQLQAAVAQRQVRAADKLLDRAHTEKIGDASAVAAAESFAAREHALLANFETAFKQLPSQLTGDPVAARLAAIADQLAQARTALNELAPDLKAENEPRLQAFEKQWQNYLADSGTAVNGLLAGWISAAEKLADTLDYRAPLAQTTQQLAALSDWVAKLRDCEAGFGKNLQLRSDLLERSATVRAKFTAYGAELKKLDDGLAVVRKAGNLKDFSEGIKLMTSSEFTASPSALAAGAIQSLDVSGETTLRILLDATNAGTWACLQKNGGAAFVPEMVMPAERKIFQQLDADPAVNAQHQHYRLWLDRDGNNKIDWFTAGVFETSSGWKQIKAWTPSDLEKHAIFEDRDYGCFDGQFRLSTTQPIFQLEHVGPLNEASAFHAVGLEKVLTGNAYAKPLLEVLDAVKDSREGSPLFRAYLFLRLVEVMNLQPNAWGLTFCPAARADAAQIRSLAGGPLDSGDWFVPARVKASSQPLEQFFASLGAVSYARQAEGLLTLMRSAAKEGLQYAGFVDLDGKPNFVDLPVSGEVFGFSAARHQPVWLAANPQAGPKLREPAMPLSPLFALVRPGREYLANAGVNPADPLFKEVLPPLFQTPLSP